MQKILFQTKMWWLRAAVAAAVALGAAGPAGARTRYILPRRGGLQAAETPDKLVGAPLKRYSEQDIGDLAFIGMADAQPNPELQAQTQAQAPLGQEQRAARRQRAGDEREGLVDAEDELSVAERAYLYDLVFLADGRQISERELDPEERHVSLTGLDQPEWAELRTQWDRLRGIRWRDRHGPSSKEVEVEAIFREEGGVAAVRGTLQAKILDEGRGNPSVWKAFNRLGNSFRATGEVYKALQCFRRALHLRSDDADIMLNVAVVLQNLGFLDDAEQMIRHAVAQQPRGVLHHFVLGNILHDQEKTGEAIRAYRASLKLQPTFVPCIKRLRALGVDPDAPEAPDAATDFVVLPAPDAAGDECVAQGPGRHPLFWPAVGVLAVVCPALAVVLWVNREDQAMWDDLKIWRWRITWAPAASPTGPAAPQRKKHRGKKHK